MSGEAKLSAPDLCPQVEQARACRRMSPSSWTAMAVGRPSAGCRASRGTAAGVEAIRRAVRTAGDLGIRYLTVYSFSSENWRRPAQEVSDLMGLLKRFVRHDLAELHANNIRVRIIGERRRADRRHPRSCSTRPRTSRATIPGLTLVIAFNYGGRQEIVRAMRALAEQGEGRDPRSREPSTSNASRRLSTPMASRIPIWSSAPRASSGSRTS